MADIFIKLLISETASNRKVDKMHGLNLIEKLNQELNSIQDRAKDREANISACLYDSSDSFLSEWANSKSQDLLKVKLQILENGGLAEFQALADLSGNIVSDRLIKTRFGGAYKVGDKWINPYVKESTLAKKGFKLTTVKKWAWACLKSNGTGLGGNVWVEIFPSNTNYFTGETTV